MLLTGSAIQSVSSKETAEHVRDERITQGTLFTGCMVGISHSIAFHTSAGKRLLN